MRYLCIACVVLAHSYRNGDDYYLFLKEALRFVIPFFFMTSGYLLTSKVLQNDVPSTYLKYAGRIALIYGAWSLIYFLNPQFHDIQTMGFQEAYVHRLRSFFESGPEQVLLVGIASTHWFFVSLILTTLFYLLFGLRRIGVMLVVSLALHLFGILAGSYAVTSIGAEAGFNTRNFLFFSALPFSIGAYIRVKGIRMDHAAALALFFGAMLLSLGEGWLMHRNHGIRMHDYGFATVFLGTGAFMVALNNTGMLRNAVLAQFGRLSLGIYAVHIILVERMVRFSQMPEFSAHWHFIETPIVLTLSTAIVLLLRQNKFTRAIV